MNRLRALLAGLPAIPIVPSSRALVLLALLVPFAVVIAATAPSAWIVAPCAALALLLMAIIDGWLAGRLLSLDYHVPPNAEVGQALAIRVEVGIERDSDAAPPEAAIGFDARLGKGGASTFLLEATGEAGQFSGEGALVPVRRGPRQSQAGRALRLA